MQPATVFYDGACGLCHRSVRFVVRRDRDLRFRFAPLFGPTFRSRVPETARVGLPDSIAVLTDDGRLLVRSAATLFVLRQLGPPWPLVARLGQLVPRAWLDRLYDLVAAWRRRLFRPPPSACPLLPPELRQRFDD